MSDFAGLKVAAFESRMAKEMTALIRKYGGDPFVAPALREIPLEEQHAVFEFGTRLLAGKLDMVIFLTGVGVRHLIDVLQTRHARESLKQALDRLALVVRGPKPVSALKDFGLAPTISVPEPNTWRELLQVLDQHRNLHGVRVAVQEYGSSNPELLEGLRQRGAEVLPVPVYRWALPEDLGPLQEALQRILTGGVDVLLITNAAQIDNVMTLLEKEGREVESFRKAARKMIVASIGPTASERLRHYGLPVDFEPVHPKMGHLVKEASEQAGTLLTMKRRAQ